MNAKERLDRLNTRKDRLAAQISMLRAREQVAERKRTTRRWILAGEAILQAAEQDAQLRETLGVILDRAITQPRDRRLFDLS